MSTWVSAPASVALITRVIRRRRGARPGPRRRGAPGRRHRRRPRRDRSHSQCPLRPQRPALASPGAVRPLRRNQPAAGLDNSTARRQPSSAPRAGSVTRYGESGSRLWRVTFVRISADVLLERSSLPICDPRSINEGAPSMKKIAVTVAAMAALALGGAALLDRDSSAETTNTTTDPTYQPAQPIHRVGPAQPTFLE